MSLSGSELEFIYEAALNAGSYTKLRRQIRTCMELDFDRITPIDHSLEDRVWALVEYAERHKRLPDLVRCIYQVNPSDPKLADLYAKFHKRKRSAPVKERQSGESPYRIVIVGCPENFEIMSRLRALLHTANLRAWYEDNNVKVGSYRWQQDMQRAVSEAICMVVILSSAAMDWEWMYKQAAAANARGLRIFSVVVEGEQVHHMVPLALAPSETIDARINFDGAVREMLLPKLRKVVQTVTALTPPFNKVAEKLNVEWMPVQAGEFLLGSDRSAYEWVMDNELPLHKVYLPTFWISKYPVTNLQYHQFVKETDYPSRPEHWQGDSAPSAIENHPAVYVSWADAFQFCRWASVSLPTEAQWEKAARGREGWLWPWGDEAPNHQRCNYNHTWMETTPVDLYPSGASPYGVMDMAGNVWEWTNSKEGMYKYRSFDGRESWRGMEDRIIRGGSAVDTDASVRCARRKSVTWKGKYSFVGFRVVLPVHNFDD